MSITSPLSAKQACVEECPLGFVGFLHLQGRVEIDESQLSRLPAVDFGWVPQSL